MADDAVEIEGKFGTHPSSKSRTSRDKLAKTLRFYRSPEGREYLRQMRDEEERFARDQEEAGISRPTKIPVDVDGFRLIVREIDPETLETLAEDVIEVEEEEDGANDGPAERS